MKTTKLTLGNLFTILSVIVGIVGIVIYGINASGSYYHDFGMTVPLIAGLALAIEVIALVLTKTRDEKYAFDILYVAAGVILMIAVVQFTGARVESAGIILGSDLEGGNALASASLYQAFAGIGCMVGAIVLEGISGFFKQN